MTALGTDVRRIAPQPHEALSDRAPDWVAHGTPEPLRGELLRALGPAGAATRALDLVRYASDASPYRTIPRAVAIPRDLADVQAVLGVARDSATPIVFRAGGTSLNGQGQGEGIMIDIRRHFQRARVEDQGARVRAQPGVILGHLNRLLARHGRRMGPDPASTDIACVGGVVANNSGGMRCGVHADSYSTVSSLTFVLANGAVIDTAAEGAGEAFAAAAPELASGLLQIREELLADEALRERIRRKFEIKNTTGYRLCAFLDAEQPLEIFRRLLIGSEGTLAFLAEAVFETLPLEPHTALSLIHFADIDAAARVVPALVAAGASATELMVAPTLIAAAWNMPGTPAAWKELPPDSAALLVEFRADSEPQLDEPEAQALSILQADGVLQAPRFTRERGEIGMLWHVREGMQGLLAAMRAPGVQLIIEDVCVPPERVAEAAKDLQAMLGRHGFLPGVAGHASAGNLHFLLTPNFGEPADLERYEAFMHEMVEMVIDTYDGSLKAEHGTGVNMAPYVEREWGAKATEMMWRVKQLADPDGILAPGVLLNREPGAHLRNLKSTPEIDEVATKCIECGFCEPVCPSRDLTTTPRQRIALRREMARQPEGSPVLEVLLEQYQYDAIDTCAADGSCRLACPVGIDTGALVKQLRAAEHSARAERVAASLARRWSTVESSARAGLRAGAAGADGPLRALTAIGRGVLGEDLIPAWSSAMPAPAPADLPRGVGPEAAAAVYFPACINRIFGNPRSRADEPSLAEAMLAVSARAGQPLWIPPDVAGNCCSTPWSSKGYREGRRLMARRMAEAALRWTREGELALVTDASSCAQTLAGGELGEALDEHLRERLAAVRVIDPIEWIHERVLGSLALGGRLRTVALHRPCAAVQGGLDERLREIADALAEEVIEPLTPGCCGMAGDRGLLHPELPAAALADSAAQLSGREVDACVSCNRTCELALEGVTGRPYESIVMTLERLTREVPAASNGNRQPLAGRL